MKVLVAYIGSMEVEIADDALLKEAFDVERRNDWMPEEDYETIKKQITDAVGFNYIDDCRCCLEAIQGWTSVYSPEDFERIEF